MITIDLGNHTINAFFNKFRKEVVGLSCLKTTVVPCLCISIRGKKKKRIIL